MFLHSEDVTLPVEAVVLSNLVPDKMFVDDTSIMGIFGACLNWHTEELAFASSRIFDKVKAEHRIFCDTERTVIRVGPT